MNNARLLAAVLAGLSAVVGFVLVLDRGGVIAWVTLLIGIIMLIKVWRMPARIDLALMLGLAVLPVLLWFGTVSYVLSVWESGEVVELQFESDKNTHTARLWVMDIEPDPIVYYDAPPDAASALLAGNPVRFKRGERVSERVPRARRVEDIPEDEAGRVLEAMQTKYGDRNDAAVLYYGLLGRSSDRVALVVQLVNP